MAKFTSPKMSTLLKREGIVTEIFYTMPAYNTK